MSLIVQSVSRLVSGLACFRIWESVDESRQLDLALLLLFRIEFDVVTCYLCTMNTVSDSILYTVLDLPAENRAQLSGCEVVASD